MRGGSSSIVRGGAFGFSDDDDGVDGHLAVFWRVLLQQRGA